VHFFNRPPSPEEVNWASGFALLPRMLRGFGDIEMLVPGFFNLMLAGVMLGYAYQRTGNLYFSIGLHAGLGFAHCGTLRRVGYKFGRWADVVLMQRSLAADAEKEPAS
jgi:membrane protease YdiL (CAAX protease family)